MRKVKLSFLKKIKLSSLKKIKEYFYSFFNKKKKKEIRPKILLNKVQNRNTIKCKKRKNIHIRFESSKLVSFFKKNNIPYLLIFCSIFIVIITFLIL